MLSRQGRIALIAAALSVPFAACDHAVTAPSAAADLEASDDLVLRDLELTSHLSASSQLSATSELGTDRTTRRARRRWLRQLRRATAPYRRFAVAFSDGYDAQATPCQETESGGMGYHYANFGLLDGVLEPTRPEILLYEPQPGGRERLVAVEYAIPYSEWNDPDTPPEIHGVSFVRNDVFNLWVLHAWVWKRNPSGTFAGWNPRVSCAHDAHDMP